MPKKDYHNWSKDKLVHELKQFEKLEKSFGLVWKEKFEPEQVAEKCKDFLPVLKKENPKKQIITNKEDINHIFIEADNYHALSVLNYTHKRKVDVIFIDPPYNTGNKSWIYNNRYVEKEDRFRHSKWLSFMSKRLKLAKNLLKDDGIIIVTIDSYELFTLGLLMDDPSFFGEKNRLGIITVVHKPEGRNQEKFFGTSNEFMLVYAKNIDKAKFNKVILDSELQYRFDEEDEEGKFRLKNFIRLTDGKYSLRENKPHFYYPIYVSGDLKNFSIIKKSKYNKVFPITDKGVERTWKTTKETFIKLANAGSIVAKKEGGKLVIYEKLREDQVIKTHWIKKEYHAYHFGTKLLESILGAKKFDFPKSLYLVMDILRLTSKRDAVILDFFAGSGTTGHAVLELNNEDGGNRQFILCTNNENNNGNGTGGIAESVCFPRIKKVIEGYKDSTGNAIAGLGGNLRYYSTEFVNNVKTDKDKRILTSRSTEMLCLAETTFDEVINKKDMFAIYENEKQMTGIIFDEDTIEDFKKETKKYKKPFVVYVFSYDHTYNEEDFNDMGNLQIVKPIPEVILNIYRKIYKEIYKPKCL
jgi:adenine-specific DNA-methyltransferase